eukprot:11167756-Lingulodinium_polyedra.AAC.1
MENRINQHMLTAHRKEPRPTGGTPGLGPFHPKFNMERYNHRLTLNLRETGMYALHPDGSEHQPIEQEW